MEQRKKKTFGELLRQYRVNAGLNQGELLRELKEKNVWFEHSSTISRWEKGRQPPPPRETILLIAETLGCEPEETDTLLSSADYKTVAGERIAESLHDIGSRLHKVDEQTTRIAGVAEETHAIVKELKDTLKGGAAIMPSGALAVASSSLQKAIVPGAFMGGISVLLNSLSVNEPAALLALVGIALIVVVAQGFLRIRKGNANGRRSDSSLSSKRGFEIGELFFVSLFVMLSVPLLDASMTGMDAYGFFTWKSIAGTPFPLLISAAINLLVGVLAAAIFYLLWFRYFSRPSHESTFGRAVKVVISPLAIVYVPVALFSATGFEAYHIAVFAVLGVAFVALIGFSSPEVKLKEWDARFTLNVTVASLFVLLVLAAAVLLIWVIRDQVAPTGTHLRSWVIDWASLGYAPQDYAERSRAGLLWWGICGIAYLLVVIGGRLVMTIHREQVAKSRSPARN